MTEPEVRRYRVRSRWQIALRYCGLKPATRAVAWALSTYMTAEGRFASPTVETLARDAGIGRSTTFEALAELEAAGWIRRDSGGGRHRTNAYAPTIPPFAEAALEAAFTARKPSSRPDGIGAETVQISGRNRPDIGPKPSSRPDPREGLEIQEREQSSPSVSEDLTPPWVALGLSWRQYVERQAEERRWKDAQGSLFAGGAEA